VLCGNCEYLTGRASLAGLRRVRVGSGTGPGEAVTGDAGISNNAEPAIAAIATMIVSRKNAFLF